MIVKRFCRAARSALILTPLCIIATFASVNAQTNTPQHPAPTGSGTMKQFQLPTPVAETPVPIVDATGEGVQILSFITPGTNFERNVVKNAPFWADSLTEHIQTLADGNRVSRKSASHIYRDGARPSQQN